MVAVQIGQVQGTGQRLAQCNIAWHPTDVCLSQTWLFEGKLCGRLGSAVLPRLKKGRLPHSLARVCAWRRGGGSILAFLLWCGGLCASGPRPSQMSGCWAMGLDRKLHSNQQHSTPEGFQFVLRLQEKQARSSCPRAPTTQLLLRGCSPHRGAGSSGAQLAQRVPGTEQETT